MLTLLLIIALSNFDIISGVEEDNKFINSLPEKEKKEFLHKVEKRIQNEVPEVKFPEGNNTNVDLYEKRLENQGKSIQTILRSEINNLKSSLRRNTNDTARQAHIDLTLRAQNDTEARRQHEEHANKSISFENIPVAVQYESENVSYGKSNPSNKTESKPDVITLENTNHVMKTVDTSNSSAERRRPGRRSNDFEFENVTLANPDINATTDAVDEATEVNINTKSQDVETTSDAVGISVKSESPRIQDVPSDTTKQEDRTQVNDENSRTAPGNINTMTVVQHSKKLDYINSTKNNAHNILTIDTAKLNGKYSNLTIESINAKSDNLVGTTAQYDKNPLTADKFSNTTQDYVNTQKDNVDISKSQYNHDITTIEDNVIATTDSTSNIDTVIYTHATADIVVRSTNKFTTTTNKVDSSTKESTKTEFLNKKNNNLASSKKIHNIRAEVDNKDHITMQNTLSHNLPNSTESGAADGVIYNDHYETTQDNIDILLSQSSSAKLDDELHGLSLNNNAIRNNLRSKSTFNVEKQKHNITADNNNTETYAIRHKTLGVVDNKDHFITIGSKKIVDVYSEPHNGYDNTAAFNLNTTDSQKGSNDLSNVETNKTITPLKKNVWFDVTESLYKTNHNVSEVAFIHKKHKTNKELNKTTLPQTLLLPKDTVQTSSDTTYIVVSLHGENNRTSDNDDERQPKYVPVYNYDPENAYFRPNTEQPSADNTIQRIGSNYPTSIKKTETHSKTTELDMYENGNKKSLRIKDIKARVIAASNNILKSKSDLYDIISGDDSVESSDDDVAYEKPLKHSLKKIRQKLYKHQINKNPKGNESGNDTNQSGVDNTYKNEVRKKYGAMSDKHKENNISELFNKFGALLQKLVDDNNEKSSETKKDPNEGVLSDRELYRDVALSLEHHNRAIRNKGIQKIVDVLEAIQNNLNRKNHKENHLKHNKLYQSRFQVKDRNGKQEQTEKQLLSFPGHIDKPYIMDQDDFEQEYVTEKSKKMKINDEYLELHASILKNLVDANDEGLQNYDWLGTTVLIQTGLTKMEDITKRKIHNIKLHPLDEELLEFCMKLHETALRLVKEKENEQNSPVERKRLSFHIPKHKKRKYFNALNRMYGELKKTKNISLIRSRYSVEDFKEFLVNIMTFLHDLHTAIKHISSITTYKKQHWFENIKQLYLNAAGEKEYLELLLHFVSARLVGLIDDRAKKIYNEEEDLTKRKTEVDRIEVEVVMVLRICNELIRLNH